MDWVERGAKLAMRWSLWRRRVNEQRSHPANEAILRRRYPWADHDLIHATAAVLQAEERLLWASHPRDLAGALAKRREMRHEVDLLDPLRRPRRVDDVPGNSSGGGGLVDLTRTELFERLRRAENRAESGATARMIGR